MKRRLAACLIVTALAACSSTTEHSPAPHAEISPLQGRPSAVAVGGGSVWVADDARGVVLRLDPSNGIQRGAPIAVSPHPVAIDADDRTVWVADRAGTITRIDTTKATVTGSPIELGGQVVDVLADGPGTWVADIE